jgi:hypothetical protein
MLSSVRGRAANSKEKGEKIMVAANLKYRASFAPINASPAAARLVGHVRHYFDQHPEIAREEFLQDAIRREIDFLEQASSGPARRHFVPRPPLSSKDLRAQSLLAQRVAQIHYQRHGLWPTVRRFLFG